MILEYCCKLHFLINHSLNAMIFSEAPSTTEEVTTTTGKDSNDPWILMQTSFLINHSLNAMTILDAPTTTEELTTTTTTTTGKDFYNHWICSPFKSLNQSLI